MSFYLALLFVFISDQLSKIWALGLLSNHETVSILPGIFHFTLVHNTGIAFGVLAQYPAVLLALISVSLVFLFVWSVRHPDFSSVQRMALGMILGGACGNWLDRVRLGAVVDFLDFRVWPVFNVADSAITVGVAVFALVLLRNNKKKGTEGTVF